MSFLPNIPQATDQLSVSQGNLLNNFGVLGAIAGNSNPSSASLNSTAGFNWLYLPPQGSTPPAGSSFTAGNIALYSFNNATTSQNELYINKQNQATTVQIPATASILSTNSAPSAGSSGWTYLPSGILIKWGLASLSSATININMSAVGPAFTGFIIAELTAVNGAASLYYNTAATTASNLQVVTSVTGGSVAWYAIGY